LDDLVPVARGLIEQDQDGRSNVAAAKALTAARWEPTSEHLIASAERPSVSTRASSASATVSSGSTIALRVLVVFVFMEFVIHSFLLCSKTDYNDISLTVVCQGSISRISEIALNQVLRNRHTGCGTPFRATARLF
jgi:hypothetical protein